MTYYVLRMGPTQPDEHHIWSDENVEWIEPTGADHAPDHGDPIGPAMCGAEEYAAVLDPMEERASSLRDYLRRADHEVCPRCVLALERRHALPPDEYRTDQLDERIKVAQACTDPDEVGERAREAIEEAKRKGLPTSDLTLTVSPEVKEALQAQSVRVAMDDASPTFGDSPVEMAGTPVLEDATFETHELSVDVDFSLSTEKMDELRERFMEDAREKMLPMHPSCRSTVTMDGEEVEVIEATVVNTEPTVLDDGAFVYYVDDDSVLESPTLGQQVKVPEEALDRRGSSPADMRERADHLRESEEPDRAVVHERLTNISGVGTNKADALFEAGYYDVDDIREASQSDLAELDCIGNALAARIKADLMD